MHVCRINPCQPHAMKLARIAIPESENEHRLLRVGERKRRCQDLRNREREFLPHVVEQLENQCTLFFLSGIVCSWRTGNYLVLSDDYANLAEIRLKAGGETVIRSYLLNDG